MPSLLTVTIPVKSIEYAQEKINSIKGQFDVVELRLDYLPEYNMAEIKTFLAKLNRPCILTVRRRDQGGLFTGTEQVRLHLLARLIQLQPDYLDIEFDVGSDFITQLHGLSSSTQLLASIHNFNATPTDLAKLLDGMQHPAISIYKIITHANSSIDALRMMTWVKQIAQRFPIVGHCMGEMGKISRILGSVVGNYLTYASIDKQLEVVKDQVTLQEFNKIYSIGAKNLDTKLFALIGDPIDASVGHIFHNNYFANHAINALYIKIKLTADELPNFFVYCRQLGFSGISITMPLKQAVLPYVENLSKINAANTLRISSNKITAINTDGLGALNALECQTKVKGKTILIIGAGGAALAIVDEACKRGARILMVNRTHAKLTELSARHAIRPITFDAKIHEHIDIVINTIPDAAYANQKLVDWLSDILIAAPLLMDINYNQAMHQLQQIAKQCRCPMIAGDAMYVRQALAQLDYWFDCERINGCK